MDHSIVEAGCALPPTFLLLVFSLQLQVPVDHFIVFNFQSIVEMVFHLLFDILVGVAQAEIALNLKACT